MAGNEVNDIVVRLLATADKIGGREREDIVYHVGRLSRAATRERTAAVEEMQKLRKKVVQQSTELKKLRDTTTNSPAFPVAQSSLAPQPPLAGGHGRYDESRLQALPRPPASSLDYGTDFGRLSRPEGLAQPMRRATSVENATPMSNGEQQNSTAGVSIPQAPIHAVQDQPGYGLFNPARFLALQSAPPTTASTNTATERSSLLDGPPTPAYAVTAANAEPVVPRGEKRGTEPTGGHSLTKQAVDQLLDEISNAQTECTGQKRRASDAGASNASVAKRQATAIAVPLAGAHSNTLAPISSPAMLSSNQHVVKHEQPHFLEGGGSGHALHELNDARAFPFWPPPPTAANHVYFQPVSAQGSLGPPVILGNPICTHCFKHSLQCDGKAHCGQGESHKCYYVLCDSNTCQGADCVKIHDFQYNLAARKSGQVRRLVLGDNTHVSTLKLSNNERSSLYSVMDRMDQGRNSTSAARRSARRSAARIASMNEAPFAGLPMPAQATREEIQDTGKGLDSEGNHTFRVPRAVLEAASRSSLPLTSEPARPGSPAGSRSIKFEGSSY